MKNTNSGAGLVELLVSTVLAVAMFLSLFAAFYSGRTAWQSGSALIEAHRNASAALDIMQREISCMFIYPPGITLQDTGLFYGEEENGFREFRFHALITRHSGKWDVCRVGYRYNPVKREIQRLFNVDLQEGKQMVWQPMVEGVNSLEFFLYSGREDEQVVFDYWDSLSEEVLQRGALPDRVGIVLKTQDKKRLFGEREFRITVSVPASGKKVFVPW